ncbi:MAG: PLP-dependent cysteine synthase family protein [Thermoanaerobaculia bacterium]
MTLRPLATTPPVPTLRPSAQNLLQAVGNTPLLELNTQGWLKNDVRIFAKLESMNPGGSIKDRPVSRMMVRALEAGHLVGGRRLLDSSSGNAGIAYAQFGAALGVEVSLVIPGNASRERLERIRAYGAEIIETDPVEGYDFAINTARRLAAEQPERYWYCDQYSNPDNWRAHEATTGQEILDQLYAEIGGLPDALVVGVGTGGTLTGVGRRLRRAQPDLHIATVIPEIFPGIEGLKPLGQATDLVPELLAVSLIDQRIDVTLDQAVQRCHELARQGIYVGPSSGAYLHAALELSAGGEFEVIVTIFSDTGERYSSTGMWQR